MNTPQQSDRLFRHRKRPQWGAAILVRQETDRITFQFEDGSRRTFHRRFAAMFEPIEDADASLVSTIQQQRREAERRKKNPPSMTFTEQVRIFQKIYPEGFADAAYKSTWRNQEGRTLKKHFDSSVTSAGLYLGQERMEERIRAGQPAMVVAELISVFADTALISPTRDLRPFRSLDPAAHEALASGLFELLHGEKAPHERIAVWIHALQQCGLPVTWSTVTTPEALLRPFSALYVRERSCAEQCLILKKKVPGRLPSADGYLRALEMVTAIREGLKSRGLSLSDNLDVYAFSWETLRPRGKVILQELRSA